MKTTTYICDFCKSSVSKDDLVELKIGVKNLTFDNDGNSYSRKEVTNDICKECLKRKGFVIEEVTKENKEEIETKNKSNLESKLIGLLEDLGVRFSEDN